MAAIPTPGIGKRKHFTHLLQKSHNGRSVKLFPQFHMFLLGLYLRTETPLNFANFVKLKICSEERQQEISRYKMGSKSSPSSIFS
jgi:hypothetical protein